MKRAAVIVKLKGDNLPETVAKVLDILGRNDVIPMLEKETIKRLNFAMPFSTVQEMRAKADFVIVLGGDGTLLYTSRIFRLINIPILAFNLGRVGFIMELDINDIERFVLDAVNNRLNIKRRMKLSSEIHEDGKLIFEEEALNEIVINKGTPSRMIELTVSIDKLPVLRYRSDGLIISTPTGSTGYTISAGGPIVHPDLDNIILSPICPHTLNMRPIVVPHRSEITVKVESYSPIEAYITYDGQIVREFSNAHTLTVRKSPVYAYITVKHNSNYYLTLRNKLGWGGDIC